MIRRALLERADLFEDPRAYEAGVADALAAVARIVGDAPVRPHARPLRRRARAGDTPVATARPEGVRVPGG